MTRKYFIILLSILAMSIHCRAARSTTSDVYKQLDTLQVFKLDIFHMSEEDSLSLEAQMAEEQYNDSIDEIYPAYTFYSDSWDSERLNPYRVPIDSLPDSIVINCSEFVYPTKSRHITSRFGERGARFHYGLDLGVKYGDTICAVFDGKVRIVDYERRGFGHYVVVRHANGLETVMAHMSRVLVRENDEVKAGEPLGLGGNTGRSTGPHLHWEFRFMGNAFDPVKLVDIDNKIPFTNNDDAYLLTIDDTYSHKTVLAQMAMARYHRVRGGDTLSHIARRYGTSVSALCRLNKIKQTSILRIGQRIRYR